MLYEYLSLIEPAYDSNLGVNDFQLQTKWISDLGRFEKRQFGFLNLPRLIGSDTEALDSIT